MNQELIDEIREKFNELDLNGDGKLSSTEVGNAFEAVGEKVPGYKLREIVAEVDKNKDGVISFEEFLEVYKQNATKGAGRFKDLLSKREKLVAHGGTSESSAEGTTHSYSEAENFAFCDWINSALKDDAEACDRYLPIDASSKGTDLFEKVKDGVLLCKMINLSVPDTIDERAINKKGNLSVYLILENQTLAINSAAAIGCTTVNIGPEDLIHGKQHLVLGLLWQIIRIGLFAKINLTTVPGLKRLLLEGETMDDLLKLSPEELLLRWFNYHLEKAGHHRRVTNFSADIKDSENYSVLLKQIAPSEAYVDRPEAVLSESDHSKRAEKMLRNADKIGCRKFVRAKDVVAGNAKLNLAFVANLFNNHPALPELDEEEDLDEVEVYEETREEKTFRNWMNSLGVNPFVNMIYNDLCNGLVLFQLFDKIKPGIVNWDKVQKPPFKQMGGKMKKIENCNYAVELGRQLRFSLVGIGGEDIHNGTKTLTLAMVWQMMRAYTLAILQSLSANKDKPVKDSDIVDWTNEKLASAKKETSIKSFKDPSICTSHIVIDLIDAIKPGSINYTLVYKGETEEEMMQNAKYALSMARKIGAHTYALPEDLVEVKPKMVLTVFACLNACSLERK